MPRRTDQPKSTIQTRFSVGDTINWDAELLNRGEHPKKLYGQGPFTVHQVVDVPTGCNYPDSYCRYGSHSDHCNVKTAETVGHPQWLAIQLSSGEIPQDSITRGNAMFSGLWFTLV